MSNTEELRKKFKEKKIPIYSGKIMCSDDNPAVLLKDIAKFLQSEIEAAERRRTEEVIEEVESLHYIKKVDRDCVTSALRSKFLKNPEQ